MASIRRCPSCGERPIIQRLDGKWFGFNYKARVIDACGMHTTYAYSIREATYEYRQACAITDANTVQEPEPITTVSLWARLVNWYRSL